MYTIWRTGHPINDVVMTSLKMGMTNLAKDSGEVIPCRYVAQYNGDRTIPISYGILRGTMGIFHRASEFWEIDRGYFAPDHYGGYYRISMNGMHPRYNPALAIDLPDDRLRALGVEVLPKRPTDEKGKVLICPPTPPVCAFYGIDGEEWLYGYIEKLKNAGRAFKVREKTSVNIPLQSDLDACSEVWTFNSTVAIEAIRQGIDTFCEAEFMPIGEDRFLFLKYLSYCQFTLEEFRTGYAWQVAQKIQKYEVAP